MIASEPRTEGATDARTDRPRVLFVGMLYAGHRTRFANLRRHAADDERIRPDFGAVSGWVEGGRLERLDPLPASVRGSVRGVLEAGAFARFPRPDAIWTSASAELAPWAWTQFGRWRRPLVLDTDATPDQMEAFAPFYYDRPPHRGLARWLRLARQRASWSAVTHFSVWSHWVAADLERSGIAARRISVIPPGIDLGLWAAPERAPHAPLRLLFVGGDFGRKGGPLLVDLVCSRFSGRVELDIVTRDSVTPAPGVRVHRAEANSQELRRLFAEADLFVLPTRAECFGIATVEAMASGLPVVVGDVGAAREIVDDGETGWLVRPGGGDLAQVLEQAVVGADRLASMGRSARAVAERRFDGARNDRRVIDLLLDLHDEARA